MKQFFIYFLFKVFTPINFSKALVIFFVGFIGRFLISYFGDINVFTEYLNPVSISFYSSMAVLAVFVSELFSFFNISLIPNFVIALFSYVFSSLTTTFIFLYNYFKLEHLNISFIRMLCRDTFGFIKEKYKLFLTNNYSSYFFDKTTRSSNYNSKNILVDCFNNKDTKHDDCSENSNAYILNNKNHSNLLRESVANSKLNFKDRFRRKFYWIFVESRKDKYGSYEFYKIHWNPDVNVYQEFKIKLKLHKETLKWILNRRNPNK